MKTFSAKEADIIQKWYVVDVKGKTLGDIASKIATVLRGKHKAIYTPHVDCGDFIIVINAREVKLTGKKTEQKVYQHHSRYANGLKTVTAGKLLETRPERIIEHAVAGMIPHNKLKKDILKKLKVFGGTEHKHEAQQPKPLDL
jgi:large subunit ribosomal protein L13